MKPARPTVVSNATNAPVVPRAEAAKAAAGRPRAGLLSNTIEVREINDPAWLESFAADWNALLPTTPGASYFHSYDWFAVYWKHFGASQRMRVMLVLDDGQLIGVVPLVVVHERTKLGKLRSLRYPLHGWGSFYGPIGADPGQALRYALARIVDSRRDWDLLDMLWIDRDGADRGATALALGDLSLPSSARAWLTSAQIQLDKGWESYWGRRKSHLRTNVRRCERRLQETGEVTYLRHRPLGAARSDGDPRWDLYEACEQIAAASWQGSSATGTTLSHDSIRAYSRAAHEAAASFGGVDMNLLLLDGRPVAFAYNYQLGGYVYGLRAGFDADACAEGAGTVLQRLMIEDSCRRLDRILDLGPGSAEAKRPWLTRVATAWRYTHYSVRSPRAQVLRALHKIKSLLAD